MSGATRALAGALVRCALRGEGARAVPHLVVLAPGRAERAVPLPPELTLGRGPGVALALPDPGASRRHARLRLDAAGAAVVEDLGSKNGLLVNGRRVRGGAAPLRDGDELTVGATVLRYVDPLAAGSPEPAPPGGAGPPAEGAAAAPLGGTPGSAAAVGEALPAGRCRALAAAAALLGAAAVALLVG